MPRDHDTSGLCRVGIDSVAALLPEKIPSIRLDNPLDFHRSHQFNYTMPQYHAFDPWNMRLTATDIVGVSGGSRVRATAAVATLTRSYLRCYSAYLKPMIVFMGHLSWERR